ncbi:MAG: PAS domain-containing protein [Acidobacteria bacterium]|nr:PAS domain-containing protein [Acidobacteriota bacterium]
MRLGLKGRFVAFVMATTIAFGVVLTALAVRTQNDRLRHELVERGKLLTTVIAANATDAMALLEVRELRRLLAEVLDQENVLEAVAFDEDGRVYTDGTLENPSKHTPIGEAERRHTIASDALLVEFSGDVMTVTRPVWLGGRPLGGVRLRYSLAGLARDQAVLARRTAMVGAVFTVLAVLAAALLTEAVTRPLKEVIRATRSLARGEAVPTLRVRTSDEVGELAAAFNEMTRRLRETTVSRDAVDRVLGTMGECLIVIGPDGTIDRVNKAVSKLAGLPEDELVGRPCDELIGTPEGFRSLIDAVSAEGPVHGLETEMLVKDGAAVPMMVSVAPMAQSSDRPQAFVVVASDLSERVRIERQKDEFVAMIHHEVRGPLTAVHGALGLLAGGVAGELSDRARGLVEIALRNSERMERLVDDLLAARKLDTGKMDFRMEDADLMPLVEQAMEATSSYGTKFDVQFDLDGRVEGARVRVDPDRLIQVLTNVLSNAVRFSPAGETVTVSVTRREKNLRVSVVDRGPGIPEEFRDQVFEKFAQAGPDDWRHQSGTGLGMSISRAIMEELGGDIFFESEMDVGTTFFVDLPEA